MQIPGNFCTAGITPTLIDFCYFYPMKAVPLPISFYENPSVLRVARALLGKVIVTEIERAYTSARIVETEAYEGITDKASHAFGGRRGKKNEHMYHRAGTVYVYICYGVHPMFNIVTNDEGIPDAVLIRAVEPIAGVEKMRERRGVARGIFTNGPGKVARALGIEKHHSGLILPAKAVYVANDGFVVEEGNIGISTRIGVDSAGACALKPYRFYVKGNPWVSHKNHQPKK